MREARYGASWAVAGDPVLGVVEAVGIPGSAGGRLTGIAARSTLGELWRGRWR